MRSQPANSISASDKDHSYALYGDFTTYSADGSESLGRYGRALTGGSSQRKREIFGDGVCVAHQCYAHRAGSARQRHERRLSTGFARHSPAIRNRRNRDPRPQQSGPRHFSATQQTRFTDYTLDGFSFGLLFRRPLPSFDEDGNPIFIRVTYERETGGPDFTVSGVAANSKSATACKSAPAWCRTTTRRASMKMRSVNGALELSDDTVLVAEYAQIDTPEFGTARRDALRVAQRRRATSRRALLPAARRAASTIPKQS